MKCCATTEKQRRGGPTKNKLCLFGNGGTCIHQTERSVEEPPLEVCAGVVRARVGGLERTGLEILGVI